MERTPRRRRVRMAIGPAIGLASLLGLSVAAERSVAEPAEGAKPDPTTAEGGASAPAPGPTAPTFLQPKVQHLGNGQYKIGLIELDAVAKRMRLPGRVLRNEPPLEFLAVTTGGMKSYESLLELGASAYEINLACILMGLDPDRGKAPQYHFDPTPAAGDPVDVQVEWEQEGKTIRVDAADLIEAEGVKLPRGEWVYTGSVVTPDGQYLAHLDGTVIGFVHDPASIIEHRNGFGMGNFGAVTANRELLPPVDSRVTLILSPSAEKAPAAEGPKAE